MVESSDPIFYSRREQQERELADKSCDPAISAIHREMADRYAGLIRGAMPARAARPRLRVVHSRA